VIKVGLERWWKTRRVRCTSPQLVRIHGISFRSRGREQNLSPTEAESFIIIINASCTPDAAAQLQPIAYACGAQRALLQIAVGAMNINELMNINDVRGRWRHVFLPQVLQCRFQFLNLNVLRFHNSKLYANLPQYSHALQVDIWPFDLDSGVRVTCDVGYLCANFDLPTPLCSRVISDVYATDRRQTSDIITA